MKVKRNREFQNGGMGDGNGEQGTLTGMRRVSGIPLFRRTLLLGIPIVAQLQMFRRDEECLHFAFCVKCRLAKLANRQSDQIKLRFL